ncbi:hypothetical protein ACH5RR_028935, partial [Cinchona calisaya]
MEEEANGWSGREARAKEDRSTLDDEGKRMPVKGKRSGGLRVERYAMVAEYRKRIADRRREGYTPVATVQADSGTDISH